MLRFLLVTVVTVALLVHNLPYLVRDQVVIWLLKNGAEKAELAALNVSWLEGTVSIEGLKAEAEGKPDLVMSHVSVDIDYAQLIEQRILLTDITLQGIRIGIREQGKSLWLGPVDLNAFQSNESPELDAEVQESPSKWSVGLKQLQLSDIDWRADLAGQKHHLQLQAGRLADFYLWDQEQPVSIDLDGALNGAPIVLESSSKPLPEEKSSELTIKLQNFPLHSVTAVFLPKLRAHIDLDLKIKASSNLGSHVTQVAQSGSLSVRNLSFEQEDFSVKQKRFAWNGSVNLALAANELTSLATSGQMKLSNLWLQQAMNKVAIDGLMLSSKVAMKGLDQIKVSDLTMDANALTLVQGQQKVSMDTLSINGSVESQDMKIWQANIPKVSTKGIALSVAGERLISLAALTLSELKAKHTEQISVTGLDVSQLKVQGNGGVFTQWNKIGAQGIAFNQLTELSINKLQLSDSKTRVLLSQQRQLTDLDWLLSRLSPQRESSSKVESTESKKAEPVRVKLNQLILSGKNPIQIVDGGIKPAFKTQLDISRLALRKVDTGSKGKTAFDLKAKSKFSTISAKGAIELFSGNYGGNWDAEIKGLELPQVSPYSLEYTGYYLQSGQLSLTTKGTIKARKLDGESDIRLNKLEVEARNGERSGEFDQKVSMPLGTAIMILQDNDDNIDLQIPLDGSLDDPQFGYQTVINKLAGKGLKNAAMGYLTKALQPFGALISIGQMVMDANEKGSFIELQPVFFKPAESVLSTESKQYMAKLAQMMTERKGMRMNLCGLAVAVDKPVIWERLVETNKKRKKPVDEEILLLELQPQLQQLAQRRSDAVKEQLSQKQKIDIERLFSCYPKVDLTSKEKPQVTLGL